MCVCVWGETVHKEDRGQRLALPPGHQGQDWGGDTEGQASGQGGRGGGQEEDRPHM